MNENNATLFDPAKPALTALIPIKGTNHKSRLSTTLTPDQRRLLRDWMLIKTLEAIENAKTVHRIRLVVGSGDPSLQRFAESTGVEFVPERASSLNGALQLEVNDCLEQRHDVLIVFADLPLIRTRAIDALIQEANQTQATLTLAPDAQQRGTNVLLYRGQDRLQMVYGANSFQKYLDQARTRAWKFHVFNHEALAQDLDTPEDWAQLEPRLLKSGFSLEVSAAR